MTVRVGSLLFDSWQPLRLAQDRWSDTFIFPISALAGLPPPAYAAVIGRMVPPLVKLRRSASLWIPVAAPAGIWYAQELRHSLRGLNVAIAVTAGSALPGVRDFSFAPWTDRLPSPPPPVAETSARARLGKHEMSCLRVLARIQDAFTADIASLAAISKPTALEALNKLKENRLVEHAKGETYPSWQITRSGTSVALRSWGVPPGVSFSLSRLERRFAKESRHRRTARLWPAWLRHSWPQAEVWTGWSEVTLGTIRPDALAWGRLDGEETLFWLEVETGHASRQEISKSMRDKINRAAVYIRAFRLRLVYCVLSQAWIRKAILDGLDHPPADVALVMADWKEFGTLPAPLWGQAQNE